MGNTSTIQIEIQVDGKGGIKVLRQIGDESDKTGKKGKKSFRAMDKSLKGFDSRILSVKRNILGLGSAILGVYGVKKMAGDFLDVASSFEQMEVKLDALTKGRGAETLAEINAWALEMPVNTRKAVDTFAMMQAMGLDPTIAKMQTLVDVSSIFSEDAMPRVARALGQMQTLGKLSAEELNQMAEAGINARKYLTQAFGMTVEELQKSKISIDQIVNAIWRGLDADFAGAAKKAQSSWRGLWTTFISYTEEAERQIMAAGIFDELKTQIAGVNEELALWIENNSELIKQKVPKYIGTVKTATFGLYSTLSDLYGLYEKIPGEVVGAAGYGIAGRIIFGGWGPAKVVGGIYLINEGLKQFNLDIGTSIRLWKEYETATNNIMDVITGKRDWHTGELKHKIQKGPATYYGKIGPETPGYDIYKPPPTPESKPPPPGSKKELDDLQREMAAAQEEFERAKIVGGGTGEIMAQQLRRGVADNLKLMAQEADENFKILENLSQRTAEAMEQNFSDYYFDVMRGEFDDLGDYADAMLMSIQRATADVMGQMTKEALFGKESGGGGLIQGIGKWIATSLFHHGGVVGRTPAPSRQVPAALFYDAPRLHRGLAGDEFPAILQKGETVYAKGSGPSIQINVINESGEPLTAEQGQVRFDGQKYIADVHIDKMINSRSYRQANRQAMGGR